VGPPARRASLGSRAVVRVRAAVHLQEDAMTVHVERATSEVVVDSGHQGGKDEHAKDVRALERLRAMIERRERDGCRTKARGYDD
jgi:hypothetical protein